MVKFINWIIFILVLIIYGGVITLASIILITYLINIVLTVLLLMILVVVMGYICIWLDEKLTQLYNKYFN